MVPSDDESVTIRLAGSFQQRFLDGTNGDADRNFQADGLLKLSDRATCLAPLAGYERLETLFLNAQKRNIAVPQIEYLEKAGAADCSCLLSSAF